MPAWRGPGSRDGPGHLPQAEARRHPVLDRGPRQEGHRGRVHRGAERGEHRPVAHRLGGRDRGVGIAHRGHRDQAALEHHLGLDPEEGRLPQHEVGELARLDRPDLVRDAVGDRGVDRVLGDVALRAGVVVRGRRPAAAPRCTFILCAVCQVRVMTSAMRPIACESDESMLIAPRSCSTSSAAIVSARMRDSAKARSSGILAFRWWHTISMSRCSSMVLTVNGIVGLVEDGRQLASPHDPDDVGGVPASRALGVIRVDRPALERPDRVLDEAGLVERVGVDRDLDVHLVGHGERGVDGGRRRSPVLVELEADRARLDLLPQRARAARRCPWPRKPRLIGKASAASSIRWMFQAPGVQVVAVGPGGGAGAAADQRGEPGGRAPRPRAAGR